MTTGMSSLAEHVLQDHLASGRFRSGVASGRWRFIALDWPYLICGVTASDSIEYGMRFECSNYPQSPVTGQPWDADANKPLPFDRWPSGKARIPLAFNPAWHNGICLYLPCDRISIEGHANWLQEHPSLVWDPAVGIVHYLRVVHDLLNSGDYLGRKNV